MSDNVPTADDYFSNYQTPSDCLFTARCATAEPQAYAAETAISRRAIRKAFRHHDRETAGTTRRWAMGTRAGGGS